MPEETPEFTNVIVTVFAVTVVDIPLVPTKPRVSVPSVMVSVPVLPEMLRSVEIATFDALVTRPDELIII